jgi:hypothetical protein
MRKKPSKNQLTLNLPKPSTVRQSAPEDVLASPETRIVSLTKKRGEKKRSEIAKHVSSIVRHVKDFK